MAIRSEPEVQATHRAALIVRDRALAGGDALFTPGTPIWSLANADELHRRFVEHPDESSDSFENKLKRQLAGAPDAAIQLMAELLYVHFLAPQDIKAETKRRNIRTVLGWMAADPPILPQPLDEGLEQGFLTAGMGFGPKRPDQIRFLIEFLRDWTSAASQLRSDALSDPWEFKAFVEGVDAPSSQSQRNALLYLIHPETYEDIVSQYHKRDIVEAFGELAPGIEDVDRALLSIRSTLEKDSGQEISFYEEPFRSRWQPAKEVEVSQLDEDAEAMRNAWLLRSGRYGVDATTTWLADGYGAIGWREAGPIHSGTRRREIINRLEDAFPDQPRGWVRSSAGNIDRFLNQMRPGDLVVTPHRQEVYVGIATSEPYWSEEGQPHRRSVEWSNPDAPIRRQDLSPSAFSKMRTLLTVSNVSDDLAEFARLAGIELKEEVVTEAVAKAATEPITLARVSSEFAKSLHVPAGWLNEVIDLLEEKRQVIFYGPPGTGKTFVAQQLADYLTEAEASTLVQFHPSYAYEDFFEGFRPIESAESVGVSFELVPGPLRRIADTAREDRSRPYVLIIDEINRANLAKVFGEMYFLLEYRDRSIALQYGGESDFTLPKNLYVIGTMNTADRSIAFVDAAMRRRFYFVPFFPRHYPIDGLLARWLESEGMGGLPAKLLHELNNRIDDDDFSIGPSYLMGSSAGDVAGLRRIWDHAIIPLLEEHYFGTGRNVRVEFDLDTLLTRVTGQEGEMLDEIAGPEFPT